MDTASLPQQLQDKLQEIKKTLEEVKSSGLQMNEAQTEHIIIDPLLQLLGYSPYQIYKQGHDGVAKNFPDYTLLPNTPHKWFLEAKKLDLNLQDGEAAQAVNYANNQGAEWAVLTNGHTWYIYNAHLPKPLTEKRVMQIGNLFSDADAVDKLLLLSRQSMQNGGLTDAWTHERVTAIVRSQLETPNSAIRKHLKKLGSEQIGVTLPDIAIGKAIASCGIIGSTPVASSAIFSAQPVSTANGTVGSASGLPAAIEAALHTFQEIAKDNSLATYRKPKVLTFSDGHQEDVNSWADAAKATVEWVGQAYKLPELPFKTGHKGNNYFLNSVALHGKGNSMLGHRVAQVGSETVYIDTNRGTSHMAASIASFLVAADAPADVVKVRIE